MCFRMPLGERGARGVWAKPCGQCPVSFIETCVGFLSHRCSNMSKIAQAEHKAKARFLALLRRRRFSSEAQRRASLNSRSYLLSCTVRQLTKRLLVLTCINDFCDRFLILRGKGMKNPDTFQENIGIFFARMNYLTFPRVRRNNRYARPFFLTMLMPFCVLLCRTPRRS